MNPRIVVLSCGNPSRGDDAIGPELTRILIQAQQRGRISSQVTLLTDFQLQIEHVTDMTEADAVVFVDAALEGAEPFSFAHVQPLPAAGITTHALSPSALLAVFEQVMHRQSPPAWVLAVRGYRFALGEALSPAASDNLSRAADFLCSHLLSPRPRFSGVAAHACSSWDVNC